jgi:hypothetical protein
MHIPRIPGASRIDHPGALARRSPSARRFELERLEARTALSSGLQAGPAAMDSYRAEVAPALIGSVKAAWTANEAGVAVPATFRSAEAAPAASRTGMLEASDIHLFAETYTNLLPLASELLAGLAGSITILGQAYRDGVPIPVLLDSAASVIGSTSAEIPPEIIPLGVAAAFTAQGAGIALPATVAGLEGMAGGSQIEGWISGAVGRIESLAAVDGSTPSNQASIHGPPATVESSGDPGSTGPDPNTPPVPPLLLSLGKFFLRNIDTIYSNYVEHSDNTSGAEASRPDRIAPNGLASVSESTAATVQEAQDIGWVGTGWTSLVMAGGRGPALSQGSDLQGGEVQSLGGSPEEPAPPASITAGEIPLDILLSDPESSTQDVSIGLQQIAELIPIEDSSLALVATLWTVPSGSRAEPADGEDPSGERAEPVPLSASPPPWAVFVIGLDEAIERSRDACGTTLSDGGRPSEGEGAGDAAGEQLEWRCPIIPNAEEMRRPGQAEESSPGVGPAAIDRAAPSPGADSNRPLPSRSSGGEELVARPCPEDGSPHDAVGGQILTEGALRSVWAASASALIAGWLWTRRQRWKLGGIGRTDHRRGGRDHSEEEGP